MAKSQLIRDIARNFFLFRFITLGEFNADTAMQNANALLEEMYRRDPRAFNQDTIRSIKMYKRDPNVQRVVIETPSNDFVDQKNYLSKTHTFRFAADSVSDRGHVIHDLSNLLSDKLTGLFDDKSPAENSSFLLLRDSTKRKLMLTSHEILFKALEDKMVFFSRNTLDIFEDIEAQTRASTEANEKRRQAKEKLKRRRITCCWNCKRDIDTEDDPLCERCGWILCPCGGCGCKYNRDNLP